MESPVAVSRSMGVSFCKFIFCGSLVMGIVLLRRVKEAARERDDSSIMEGGKEIETEGEGERERTSVGEAEEEGGGWGGRMEASWILNDLVGSGVWKEEGEFDALRDAVLVPVGDVDWEDGGLDEEEGEGEGGEEGEEVKEREGEGEVERDEEREELPEREEEEEEVTDLDKEREAEREGKGVKEAVGEGVWEGVGEGEGVVVRESVLDLVGEWEWEEEEEEEGVEDLAVE